MEFRKSPKPIWSILNHLSSERKYHPRIFPCVPPLYTFIHDNLPHTFRVVLYFGKTAAPVPSRTRLPSSRRKITSFQLKHFVIGDTREKYWERTSASQRRTISPCWDEKHKAPACVPHYVNLGRFPIASEMHQRNSECCSWNCYCGLSLFSSWQTDRWTTIKRSSSMPCLFSATQVLQASWPNLTNILGVSVLHALENVIWPTDIF